MTQALTEPVYAERIEAVKKFIRVHIDEPLDRAVLAQVAGFSVAHFHRLFAVWTGMSIAGYVRAVRMERAGRKLRMGAVDITEVALAAGYDSHASFARAFKRHFGLCPSDFRQLTCNEATQRLRKGRSG
ncbi:MAG: helix-turn-helix transcriptional regulator [Caldilineaceae bacterium]|nr:helix-turn-helix transcriptional regulator [Caldilineaceae bacterium]